MFPTLQRKQINPHERLLLQVAVMPGSFSWIETTMKFAVTLEDASDEHDSAKTAMGNSLDAYARLHKF